MHRPMQEPLRRLPSKSRQQDPEPRAPLSAADAVGLFAGCLPRWRQRSGSTRASRTSACRAPSCGRCWRSPAWRRTPRWPPPSLPPWTPAPPGRRWPSHYHKDVHFQLETDGALSPKGCDLLKAGRLVSPCYAFQQASLPEKQRGRTWTLTLESEVTPRGSFAEISSSTAADSTALPLSKPGKSSVILQQGEPRVPEGGPVDFQLPAALLRDRHPTHEHVRRNLWGPGVPRPKRLPKDDIPVCCCRPPRPGPDGAPPVRLRHPRIPSCSSGIPAVSSEPASQVVGFRGPCSSPVMSWGLRGTILHESHARY